MGHGLHHRNTINDGASAPGRARRWAWLATFLAVVAGAVLPTARVAGAEEAAAVACTISWDGGAGTAYWLDQANWTDDRLPTYADDVCVYSANAPATGIALGGASLQTINSFRADIDVRVAMANADAGLRLVADSSVYNLYVDSGYVEVDASLTTASVIQSGGAIGGPGSIAVNGDYRWSGGMQYGSGWTSIQSSSNGTYGLYVYGGNELRIDRRLVETQYGFDWADDTSLVLTNEGILRNDGTSAFAAPGGYVSGQGGFENHGGIYVNQDADVFIESRYATVDRAWFDVAALGTLTLSGASAVPGDMHLQAGSALIVNGPVEFTPESQILGEGTVYTSAEESALVARGTVDVGTLAPERGTMTFHAPVKARDVDATGGALVMENAAALDADNFWLIDADFGGSARVTGDAWLENAGVSAPANLAATFAVGGTLSVAGDVAVDRIAVTAADLAFEQAEPDSAETEAQPTAVYLLGSSAEIDVAGTASSAIVAGVETDLTNSFGAEFHAHTIEITGGAFDLDAPTTIGPDDTVTVTESGLLKMSNVVQRGTFTVAGMLNLTGEATIESDIEANGTAQIGVEENAHPELVGGATIGGAEAIVTNLGWISGEGALIGDVANLGLIEPTHNIDVLGPFTQADDAGLLIAVDGDQYGHLNVVGDASLAGEIDLVLAEGGTLPTEPFEIISASGSIDTSAVTVNGLDNCSTMRFDARAVRVVPQPCVAVASGSAGEAAGQLDFGVTLSKPFAEPVIVHYGVVPGTADITDIVDPGPSSITVPSGATSATISIGLVDDEDEEQDETFTVAYTVEGGRAQAAEATGTIVDDDVRLDYRYQSIPVPGGGIQYYEGIGTDYVVGIYSADAATDLPWVYRISDGAFAATQRNFMPSAINAHDQAVGGCNGFADPCMRAHSVDTFLDEPGGASAQPRAIADSGEIVGYVSRWDGSTFVDSPVRWADAESPAQEFTGLGGTKDAAVDVNAHGVIVGESRFGTDIRGWARYADGRVVEIGPVPGLPSMNVAGISDDGVVVGTVSDGQLWSEKYQGFTWTEADGITLLGPLSAVLDIAPSGDYVGYVAASATLWRDGRTIDLNRALGLGNGSESGIQLSAARLINDDGAIVVTGYGVTGVLIPPGAGCSVCLDGHLYERQFPTGELIDAGETIVEGNPSELFADIVNNDDETRSVTVSFLGPDGQPLGEPHNVTVVPGATEYTFAELTTEGLAWKDGADAGPVRVTIEMRDEGGNVIATDSFETRIVPRPVVNVHGMNSDESTWGGYAAFVSNAHFGWKAFAVDQMDTMPWQPNTIADNAAVMADYVDSIQRQENAWQVDLVAHSMGGLISRYYVQNLMVDHDGIRPARRLVMLGTPNAGSPCADLFSVPMTAELRTDVMRRFNQVITDRRGVPFSVAAGDPLPATCQQIGDGDGVVSLESALTGMTDSGIFDILHTDMTFSQGLFDEFVLPRLNGVLPAADASAEPAGMPGFAATAAEPAATAAPPQLLQTDRVTVAAGETWSTSVQVPSGLSALGVTGLGTGDLEIALVQAGVVVATSGTTDADEFFRSIGTQNPARGTWTVQVTNHGTTPLDVPLSTWVQGAANTLVADVAQVGISTAVKVTARIEGPALTDRPLMSAVTLNAEGQMVTTDLYDDATHGDAVAGDGTFTGQFSGLPTGPVVVEVYANSVSFSRMTTAGTVLAIGTDGPGNDAPVAGSAAVNVPGGQISRIVLQAADPEGDPLIYEIVAPPAHGLIGGFLPYSDYLPNQGYIGPDSFTFRVHDGQKYSAPATVDITVGRMNVEMLFRQPMPPEPTAGSTMQVVLRVEGPRDEAVDGGDVTITFDGRTITAPVIGGRVEADVPVDLPGGNRTLTATFNGNSAYAPLTITQVMRVQEGVAPMPGLEPVTGEAGYPVRLWGHGGDNDGDIVTYEFDVDGDGVYDAVLGPQEYGTAWIDHVYPDAFDGQARFRVTDAVGHVAVATAAVHIAPHRDLGALARIVVAGEPIELVAVSDDGRYVMYEATDHEDGSQLPTPYRVLDRQTGEVEDASVRPDGTLDTMPRSGTLSPDGRTVAFVTDEYVNGKYAPQVYVRHLDTDVTDPVPASVNGAGQRAGAGVTVYAVTNGGTKVLFETAATNMVDFDIVDCGTDIIAETPCTELYQRDVASGTTTLMSAPHATRIADIESRPGMSGDGRYVAYASRGEVWFVDTVGGSRERLFGGATGNRYGTFQWIGISDDGRYVTGTTAASNIIPGDTNGVTTDAVRFDRQNGQTTVLALTPAGAQASRGAAFAMDDSCSARSVFWSSSSDLVTADANGHADIFVREPSGQIRRVSVEARDGTESNYDSSPEPVISGNGRFVFFESDAWNLIPGDVEGWRDTFVLDLGATSCGTQDPVNHAPVAGAVAVTTGEDGAVAVALAASDADGDALSYTVVDAPAHGTLSGTAPALDYTPAANWHGTDTFTYTVSDGELVSQAATVTVTVTPVNDVPAAAIWAPPSLVEGGSGLLHVTATDPDGDPLTVTWATDGGALEVAADGTSATLAGGDGPAVRTVTVLVADATSSVTASADIAVVNVAPTVRITDPAANPSVSVGTAVAFSATTADAGGDAVTCAIAWGDGNETAGCSGSHAWSAAGTYTVTVTATDDDGASNSATRAVTVTAPQTPVFDFDGFYAPVDNVPVVNVVKAGSVVPLKFSLGGNFGLDIFAAGYPASAWRSCTGGPTDALEETVQPGATTLTYDAASGRYHYNWQTLKSWAGTCRTLVLRFIDGTEVTAEFRFK